MKLSSTLVEHCIVPLTGSIRNLWRKNSINARMTTSWLSSHLSKATFEVRRHKCIIIIARIQENIQNTSSFDLKLNHPTLHLAEKKIPSQCATDDGVHTCFLLTSHSSQDMKQMLLFRGNKATPCNLPTTLRFYPV